MNRRHFVAGLPGLASIWTVATRATAGPGTGWVPLFNGNDLTGWTLYQQGGGGADARNAVVVRDGMIHMLGPAFTGPDTATFGHIATADTWRDFHLRLEFRWGERRFAPRLLQRRNSGILYHMGPERDRLFPDCVEYQVEEGDVGDAVMVNTRALQGPQLGGTPLWPTYFPGLPQTYEPSVAAGGVARQWFRHAGQFEKLDDWNTLDLYAFGDQAAHLVNGRIVTTLFRMIGRSGPDGAAGKPLTAGRIGLEFEAAEVFFRNVAIRRVDPDTERF